MWVACIVENMSVVNTSTPGCIRGVVVVVEAQSTDGGGVVVDAGVVGVGVEVDGVPGIVVVGVGVVVEVGIGVGVNVEVNVEKEEEEEKDEDPKDKKGVAD
jgi:hypothetical protein